ncbi:MAG: hypothetical protein WBQ62_01225, partial [Dehalococcoidales bacterium]
WFTNGYMNQIGKISPINGKITEYPVPTKSAGPDSITAGPDGNLWFVVCQGNVIDKISPDNDDITEYPILSSDFGNILNEITEGPDGNLWFTLGEHTKSVKSLRLQVP